MSAVAGGAATSITPSPRSGIATTSILARGAVADASRREGGGEDGAFARELGRIGHAGKAPHGVRAGSPTEASRRVVPEAEDDRSAALDAAVPAEAAIVGETADRVPEPTAPGDTGVIPLAVPIDGTAPSSDEPPAAASDAVHARVANGGSVGGTTVPAATAVAADTPTETEPALGTAAVGTAPRDTATIVPTAPEAVETSERASASGTSDEELVAPAAPAAPVASAAFVAPVASAASAASATSATPVATVSEPTASTVGESRSDDIVDAAGTRGTDRAGDVRATAEGAPRPPADTSPPGVPGNAPGRDAATPLADRNRGEDVSDAAPNLVDADVRRPRSAPRTEERGGVERPAPPVLLAVPAGARRTPADGAPLPRGDTGDAFPSTPPAAAVPLAPAVSGRVPDAAPPDTRPALPVGIARALRAAETASAERAPGVDAVLEASPSGTAPRTLPGEAVGAPPATPSSATVPTAVVPLALAPLATRPEAPLPTASIAPQTVPLDGAGGGAETLAANVRWTAGEGRGQAWINVSPATLGPLAIRVSVEGEQVSVSIAASQAGAREALEPLIPRLREQLAADGHQSVHVDLSGGREDPRASADARDARAGADGGGRSESGRTADGEDERNARHAADARRMPEGPTAGLAGGHALVDAWA